MPFTPSHAVVALPFVRTPLVPAAIAVGAMTPDLPLFVRFLPLHYGRTHDFAWLAATVALALALLLIWRAVLRPAFRELAPRWVAERIPSEWDRNFTSAVRETFTRRPTRGGRRRAVESPSWTAAAVLLMSLALGVASHIVWDHFTHEGRWGAAMLPALDDDWGPLPGYKWLQHGSSVVGLAIVAVYLVVWLLRRDASTPVPRVLAPPIRYVWWLSLPVVLPLAWLGGVAAFGPLDAEFTVAHLAYRVLPPACALWGLLTVGLCVTVQVLRAGRPASAASYDAAG